MSANCFKNNPLKRDGTSQTQRLLKSLKTGCISADERDSKDKDYINIDEKDTKDIIIYLRNYSDLINFHYNNEKADATHGWKSFIENDITTQLAVIASEDLIALDKGYNDIYNDLNVLLPDASQTDTVLSGKLKDLYKYIEFLAKKIDSWYTTFPEGIGFKEELGLLISSVLKDRLIQFIRYGIDATAINGGSNWFDTGSFNLKWEIPAGLTKDNSIYSYTATTALKIKKAAERFSQFYNSFLDGIKRILSIAPDYINKTTENYPSHKAHFALLLAFIKLFKYAQNHINTITERHIKYYFKKVLKINKLEAVPDKAHVIFEIAKNFYSQKIVKDTALKAGKDNTKVEMYYDLEDEIIVNKSSASLFKAVRIDKEYPASGPETVNKIYSFPVVNSKNGLGTKIDNGDLSWKTFGFSKADIDSMIMGMTPGDADEIVSKYEAEIGFAIASPEFFLNEGNRNIKVKFGFKIKDNNLDKLQKNQFKAFFTGPKGWIEAKITHLIHKGTEKSILTFKLFINETLPPLVTYNPGIHGSNFNTKYPMLKITLANNGSSCPYEILKHQNLSGIIINCCVLGVKDFIIQNENGVLDINKPFQPFGPLPVIGSQFYIGSSEIFRKKLNNLKFKIVWHKIPNALFSNQYKNYKDEVTNIQNDIFKVKISLLNNKRWAGIKKENNIGEYNIFDKYDAHRDVSIPLSGIQNSITKTNKTDTDNFGRYNNISAFDKYTNDLVRGFARLELTGSDFLQSKYPYYVSSAAISRISGNIPLEPYTPTMKSLTLNYTSTHTIDFSAINKNSVVDRIEGLFHLTPFGQAEIFPSSNSDNKGEEINGKPVVFTDFFLPQFTAQSGIAEGSLYIGIKDLVPPQNLSLLFQVSEGSENPDLNAATINWSYFSNNTWQDFLKPEIIKESTNRLLKSGIIELSIPGTCTKNNTILDSDYYWIRASVLKDSEAVCNIIEIKAQAAVAVFNDLKNDPNHYGTPLEANKISKFKEKSAQIKSVSQPYSSFDGKMKEKPDSYKTRISERLRHKQRGITIWDYERLVLQNFPPIYKVKCINHTNLCTEIAPGNVKVIVIPDIRNKNAANKLEPKVSLNLLEEIKDFLSGLNPLFVKLEVKNPIYEKINLNFNVKFRSGYDEGYYTLQLKNDIVKYMCPWLTGNAESIKFGGKTYKSVLINFMEDLEYVDYLTDVKMFHPEGNEFGHDLEYAEASTSSTVMVSDSVHTINGDTI
jgi:hypothetical protein